MKLFCLFMLQVKVHVSVREVVALYTVDEARMELVVKMPNNHPLGLIKVDSGQNFVCSSQWRNWMMQLTIFLTHQVYSNCTILLQSFRFHIWFIFI